MTVTTLTGHRRVPAFGLAGGEPGALGRHWIEHPDGPSRTWLAANSVQVAPGDVFVIETPGGGGYGPAVAGLRPQELMPNGRWYQPSSASSSRSTAISAASSPPV